MPQREPTPDEQAMLDAISKVAGSNVNEIVLLAIDGGGKKFLYRRTPTMRDALSLSDVLHGHFLKLSLRDPEPKPRPIPPVPVET